MHKTLTKLVPAPQETDVERFIREQNLAPYITTATRLIAAHFSDALDVTMERKEDPEFDDEWVTIKVRAVGDVDLVLRNYNAVTRELCATIPAEVGRKIRLSLG